MQKDPIVIVGAARTAQGSMQGSLSSLSAPYLGAQAMKAAIERAGITRDAIDEVIMGCVLSAGLGQAPARQAAMAANIPDAIGATTLNKMCGSGMKAVMMAHDLLCCNGDNNIMLAGGMESMSNAPYLLPKARKGYRLGHGELIDHMFFDGLEDAYSTGKLMGWFAEETAKHYGFTRQEQDDFAINSLKRAQEATHDGSFVEEITPITLKTRKESLTITQDEAPLNAKLEKIPELKPAFQKDGTITAANASSISDGASALVLMRRSLAIKQGLKPLASIVAHATHSQAPSLFTTAPVKAIEKIFQKTHWSVNNVDLFEINEAFAMVTMAAMRDLAIPHEKVNIHGGACALGHPIGATGARIIITLIHALKKIGGKRGVAALCIGGGEATALALELNT